MADYDPSLPELLYAALHPDSLMATRLEDKFNAWMHFHHPQSPPRPPPPAPGSPAQHEPFALWLIAQDRFKFPSEEDLDADDPFSPARCALRLFLMEARRLFPGTGPDQNPTRAEWKLRMAFARAFFAEHPIELHRPTMRRAAEGAAAKANKAGFGTNELDRTARQQKGRRKISLY